MKKKDILLIGIVLLLMPVLFWVLGIKIEPAPAQKKQASVAENPYAIETFRKKNYSPSPFKLEKTIGNYGPFTSHIVSYRVNDLKINTLLLVPNSPAPKKGYPVVILAHGYIDPRAYSTQGSYAEAAGAFSGRGFLVLKPDFRGNAESEGDPERALNRLDYAADLLTLISSVHNLSEADPDNIFLWGHSMGGEIVIRALEVSGGGVRGASLWAPAVTDFPESILYFVRKHRPARLASVEAQIKTEIKDSDFEKVSTLRSLTHIKTPLIIHHGTLDESVPYEWGEALDKKLQEAHVARTFYTYRGENHNFDNGSWRTLIERDAAFFKKLLR